VTATGASVTRGTTSLIRRRAVRLARPPATEPSYTSPVCQSRARARVCVCVTDCVTNALLYAGRKLNRTRVINTCFPMEAFASHEQLRFADCRTRVQFSLCAVNEA